MSDQQYPEYVHPFVPMCRCYGSIGTAAGSLAEIQQTADSLLHKAAVITLLKIGETDASYP